MKRIQVSEDFLPVGDFKAHASRVIRRVREGDRPVVITQNGRPAAVLISPADFDRLVARERFVDAVEEGLADLADGRLIDDDALDHELDTHLGPTRG